MIRDDFLFMKDRVHPLLPENTPAVFTITDLPFGNKKVKIYSCEGYKAFYEINIVGGYRVQWGQADPTFTPSIRVKLNGLPEKRSSVILRHRESESVLSSMIALHAKLFLRSNEEIALLPSINSGDFIQTADGQVHLVTARGNLLQPALYAFTRLPSSHIFDRPGLAKGEGLSARQKFVLSHLLVHEEIPWEGEEGFRWEEAFWPVEAIFAGISRALKDEGHSPGAALDWWRKGQDSPCIALQETESKLRASSDWSDRAVSNRMKALQEYILEN